MATPAAARRASGDSVSTVTSSLAQREPWRAYWAPSTKSIERPDVSLVHQVRARACPCARPSRALSAVCHAASA